MATITKKDLIDRIAESEGCKRIDVKKIIQAFLDEMIAELAQGNRLEFRDFGVLETKARAARVAQNPKTLERVSVPAKRTVKFKVGRLLKERLDDYTGLSTTQSSEGRVGAASEGLSAEEHLAKKHLTDKPSVVVKPGIGNDGKIAGRIRPAREKPQ